MRKLIVFLLLVLGGTVLTGQAAEAETVVTYTIDSTSIFANPERGFTDEISGRVSDTKPYLLKNKNEDYFDEEGLRQTESLVVILYNLYNYKTKALSTQMLSGFDADMQVLRDKGFKAVLRFAYSESDKNDATKAQVLAHLDQLKPYLIKNADVIYVLEAGFVGEWGEWYYSANFGNESQQLNADRREVLVKLLETLPQDRFLLVRYPLIKTQYLGDETALTDSTAYGATDRARIGHHNDAFLNDWGNDGTYGRDGADVPNSDDDPILRKYISDETLYVPNGGETNVEDDTRAATVYTDAEKEMAEYHWSFCGSEYSENITDRWKNSNIMDNLNLHMGYRFQMENGEFSSTAAIGGEMNVRLLLRNVGYAPLYNERHAYLVLKNASHTYSLRLSSDPRKWKPGLITISESLTLPPDIEEGLYQLYLHLPDAYASLADNSRFAVRMANTGTWDAATGMNSLQASIQIAGEATDITTSSNYLVPQKIIRNGQIYILRNGVSFDILGKRVQ